MKKCYMQLATLALAVSGASTAYAYEAPVYNATSSTPAMEQPFSNQAAQMPAVANAQAVPATANHQPMQPALVQQMVTRDDANQNMDLLSKLERQDHEIRVLRGQVEMLTHEVKQLETLQRNLYTDVDKRLNAMSPGNPQANSKDAYNMAMNQGPQAATAQNAAQQNNQQAADTNQPPAKSTDILQQQNLYQQAYKALRNKHYTQAAKGMQAYINEYPQGTYAVNAHYWLGELYLISGNGQQAKTQFNTVLTQYPHSPKAADALLKIGFIYYEDHEWAKAEKTFINVKKKYPHSTSAKLAETRLRMMKESGI